MTTGRAIVACCCFVLVASSSAQNRESDSQTLQEILSEIKAIHQDMRVTQSTQILLAELEMQQTVVNGATEKVEGERSKLLDVHRNQKLVASDLARTEERLDKSANEDEKRSLREDVDRLKGNVAAQKLEEQALTTSLQGMEDRLKTAQDSLDTIEKELGALIARLRPTGK